MKKEFEELISLMNLNQYYHACYETFLKYDFDDNLKIITIEDPNYKCESFDRWRKDLSNDYNFRVFTKEEYKRYT